MVFYKRHRIGAGGFTLVEAVVATALIGIGVACTLGALTKFNSIAATSRNATGASAVVMNQIDLFQSMSPFNPQPRRTNSQRYRDASDLRYDRRNAFDWLQGPIHQSGSRPLPGP